MTKSQLKTLETLLAQEDTKGKKLLERVIWLNTTKPKYEIGDFHKVTERGHYIYGVEIRNMNAKIIKIESVSNEKKYIYKVELEIETPDEKHCTITAWIQEGQINELTYNNLNRITPIDKYQESMDAHIGW